jgi:hypothetical protein
VYIYLYVCTYVYTCRDVCMYKCTVILDKYYTRPGQEQHPYLWCVSMTTIWSWPPTNVKGRRTDCSSLKQDLPMQNVTGLDFHTSHTVVLHSTLTGFTPHTRSPGFQTQLFTCLLLLINLLGFTLFTEFHWILIWHCVVYWTKYIALYCYTGPEISLALNNIIVKSFSKISQFWRKYFHLNC